jgi:hypothetical protein
MPPQGITPYASTPSAPPATLRSASSSASDAKTMPAAFAQSAGATAAVAPCATSLSRFATFREHTTMPLWNKGTAFNDDKRAALAREGLLPPQVESIQEQSARAAT